jgi:hypothetical protein
MNNRCLFTVFCLFAIIDTALGDLNRWSQVGLTDEYIVSITVDPTNSDIIYAGGLHDFVQGDNTGGLFRTTDHGLTWDTIGFRRENVNDIAVDRNHPNSVWAAAGHLGVYHSTDRGQSWEAKNSGMYFGGIDRYQARSIAVSPYDSNLLFCGGCGDMGAGYTCRSTDGGDNWTYVEMFRCYQRFIFDTLVPGRIFTTGLNTQTPRISLDSGRTFTLIDGVWSSTDIALHLRHADWFWVATIDSFIYTTDLGQTWVRPTHVLPPDVESGERLIASPENENVLYRDTGRSIYRTEDGGLHWTYLSANWHNNGDGNYFFAMVHSDPPEIWVGQDVHGIVAYTIDDTMNSIRPTRNEQSTTVSLSVYPNPARNSIFIKGPSNSGNVKLFNVLGQQVASLPYLANGNGPLLLPGNISNGIFYVHFEPYRQETPTLVIPLIVIK